jgi:hypothetical protein
MSWRVFPRLPDGDDSLVVGQINSIDDDLRAQDIHSSTSTS